MEAGAGTEAGGSERSRPALVAVDDDAAALARIEDELQRRYAADYRIVCERSAPDALALLEAMRAAGEDVAVVLADQWMPDLTGDDLLASVRRLHPHAKRGLLVDFGAWGDRPTADAILRAMALGHIDYYVVKPWRSPDEYFHRTLGEFLHEWARLEPSIAKEVAVVGEQWSTRAHELRNLLARNGVPHAFYPSDSEEGRRVIARTGESIGGQAGSSSLIRNYFGFSRG